MCSQLSHGPPHDHRRCECIQSRTLFPTASVYFTRSRNRCVRPDQPRSTPSIPTMLYSCSCCTRSSGPLLPLPRLQPRVYASSARPQPPHRHVPFRPHPAAACMTSMCVLVKPTPRRPKLPGDRQCCSRSECMGDQMMSYLAFKLFILTNILMLTSLYIYIHTYYSNTYYVYEIVIFLILKIYTPGVHYLKYNTLISQT